MKQELSSPGFQTGRAVSANEVQDVNLNLKFRWAMLKHVFVFKSHIFQADLEFTRIRLPLLAETDG